MKISLKANLTEKIGAVGNYFRILEASGAISVTLYNQDGSTSHNEISKGMGWQTQQAFNAIELSSSVNQDVEFIYTNGRIDDDRITGVIDTRNAPLSGFKTTVLAVGAVEFIAVQANASRYGLILKNTGADIVKIGSVDVVLNGYKMSAGEVLNIKSSSASEIYAVANTLDSELTVLEEFKEYNGVLDTSNALFTEANAIIYAENGQVLNIN